MNKNKVPDDDKALPRTRQVTGNKKKKKSPGEYNTESLDIKNCCERIEH